MTERVLMETRHPDTFGGFTNQPGHAPGSHWVPLSVPGCLLWHSLHAAGHAEWCSHSASCPHRAMATSRNIQMSLKCSSMSPACLTHPGFPECRSCPNPARAVRELQWVRVVVDSPHLSPSATPWLSSMNEDVFQLWGPPGSSHGFPPSWHGMSTGQPRLVHLHSPGRSVWKVVWADLQVPGMQCY